MAVTVSSGQTHDVNAGSTEIGDLVLSGGTLDVSFAANGGTISNTVVDLGGVDNIGDHGIGIATDLNGGDENIFSGGVAQFTTVAANGEQVVFGAGSATDTIVASGFQVAFSGALVEASFVYGGGTLFVESGGLSLDAQVSGGVVAVEAAGSVTGTSVFAGHQVIAAGGHAIDATVFGGDELVAGTARSTTIGANGAEVVEVGGSTFHDVVDGGVQVVFGSTESSTVESGGIEVAWGSSALAARDVISAGSFEFVVSGALAGAGGEAQGETILGAQFVVSGGRTSNSFVLGTQVVSNSIVASSVIGIGGVLVVDPGGLAQGADPFDSGIVFVEAGGSAEGTLVGSAGEEYLFGGLDTSSTVAVSGTMFVESGGVTSDTLLSGSNGGVQGEAFQYVASGGTAIATSISISATMEVASGGSVGGSTVTFTSSASVLRLDDSQEFSGSISGFDSSPGNATDTNFLDLRDIVYGSGTHLSWTSASGSGTLMVMDGTHTAHLLLLGNYTAGDFKITSDGAGGTEVFDPGPSTQASGTTLATYPG
jgi:autotransporter passenger strand-loop-strand repeat protein